VYISNDAGLTWKQTLRDLYFFNMGDHGGILTAVKYFKLRGETRHVLYSTDEGENWKQAAFHDQDIRLYGLMTEPGENTTVFTMFGSLPQEHQWIIVKLDMIKTFEYNCSKVRLERFERTGLSVWGFRTTTRRGRRVRTTTAETTSRACWANR
jgi:hypothetical protein